MKEHFPVWWHDVSAQMHENGISLPEMNEYDKSTTIQNTHTKFNNQLLWSMFESYINLHPNYLKPVLIYEQTIIRNLFETF